MVTLVLVDDDEGFRSAARRLLEAGGFCVVGEAGDAETAGPVITRTHPEVALVDIQLPGADGFAVARAVRDQDLSTRVVLVSGRDRRDYGGQVEQCGAAGFIDKADLSAPSLHGVLQETP
jgi:DNA-binding NarL/FixJ family response regulator